MFASLDILISSLWQECIVEHEHKFANDTEYDYEKVAKRLEKLLAICYYIIAIR